MTPPWTFDDAPYDAVVFDLDGVLVDSEGIHLLAYQRVFARRGVRLEAARYRLLFGRSRDQVIEDVLGPCPPTVLHELMAEKGHEVEQIVCGGAAPAVPGAVETVVRLAAAGVPLGVATSSRSPEIFLRGLGILQHFREIVDRTMVERPKPDPQPYRLVCARLGVSPGRTVVVEDSPAGVRSARSAGARVIGLATTHLPDALVEADRVARTHADVRMLLHT